MVGAVAATQFHSFNFNPAPVANSMASHQPHLTQTAITGTHLSAAPSPTAKTTTSQRATHVAAQQSNHIPPVAAAATTTRKPKPKPSATAGAAPRPTTTATTLTCGPSTGMVPANYAAIVTYLTSHGYTAMAAAGIAGNIYQESVGNPESVGTGGGGLIGWTPLPTGFVTGNPTADLQTQLAAILTYNQQWAQYIPALNAATTPTQAADIYMNDFERPGIPAASNREAAAVAVAQACGIA